MILDFNKEISEVKNAMRAERPDLALAFVLAKVLDRGVSAERDRCIGIIQRKSANAMDVVAEIRKPLR